LLELTFYPHTRWFSTNTEPTQKEHTPGFCFTLRHFLALYKGYIQQQYPDLFA